MTKSIKLQNNTYWDSKGIIYKGANLETTIDNIKNNIPTKISQLSNDSGYITSNDLLIPYSFSTGSSGGTGLDEFKNYIVNNAPVGFSWWYININGGVSCALVQKANNNYLSFLHFSYGVIFTQYRYLAGTWYSTSL